MVKNIDGGLIKTLSLFGVTGKSQVPIIMISNFISYHRPIDLVEGRGYQSRKYQHMPSENCGLMLDRSL